MHKQTLGSISIAPPPTSGGPWLDLEQNARVEVTSEDLNHPIESAFALGEGPGLACRRAGYTDHSGDVR